MNLAPAITLLPWLLSGLLLAGTGLLAWKIGVPAVKIASLDQHIKLLELRLSQADDRAKLAEAAANDLRAQLDKALTELGEANRQIRTLVGAFEIKQKLDRLADALQPVTRA